MQLLALERRMRLAFAVWTLGLFSASTAVVEAARFETKNFVVTAPTEDQARQIAEAAEYYRRELSLEWTGRVMPNWSKPCPITTKIGNVGAGGATTFSFDRGEVFGWRMNVQGSMERILDSVIPHEVNHTVFACYFRRPLPRWADEGAATLTEHESEKARQTKILNQVIRTSRRIPLQQLLSMKEYPTDMKDVLTLYAEGYALADLLVQQQGKVTYLKFLQDAHERGWETAIQKHYPYKSVNELEREWSDWIIAGSPAIVPDGQMLASAETPDTARGQSEPLPQTVAMSNDFEVSHANIEAIGDELLEFGEGELRGAAGQAGKLDRSRLSYPVHQVPDESRVASASYAAFKPALAAMDCASKLPRIHRQIGRRLPGNARKED